MAQVRALYCDLDFVLVPTHLGFKAVARLAAFLGVGKGACRLRLNALNIKLPPTWVVLQEDMARYDFSKQWNNRPTREAIFSHPAQLAAQLFPESAGVYLSRLQAYTQGTTGTGAPPGECTFVCTPLCAAHRSLSARRFAAERMPRASVRTRRPSKRPSSAE